MTQANNLRKMYRDSLAKCAQTALVMRKQVAEDVDLLRPVCSHWATYVGLSSMLCSDIAGTSQVSVHSVIVCDLPVAGVFEDVECDEFHPFLVLFNDLAE